ncbi:hypothetical protein K491DRAFT_721010 [Lophiostoma macrostomum CBS 122681]|uniref:Uncharacterized protein n=1 Tax=Lophiostoma macrostomum CBS 122681 TaxID=1314788 RepID=A0A6A6SQM3_9PLEO|nr:hypothetical protein K491DRAFT_721010 [Lophiostoma macrostomum CBS 122681]
MAEETPSTGPSQPMANLEATKVVDSVVEDTQMKDAQVEAPLTEKGQVEECQNEESQVKERAVDEQKSEEAQLITDANNKSAAAVELDGDSKQEAQLTTNTDDNSTAIVEAEADPKQEAQLTTNTNDTSAAIVEPEADPKQDAQLTINTKDSFAAAVELQADPEQATKRKAAAKESAPAKKSRQTVGIQSCFADLIAEEKRQGLHGRAPQRPAPSGPNTSHAALPSRSGAQNVEITRQNAPTTAAASQHAPAVSATLSSHHDELNKLCSRVLSRTPNVPQTPQVHSAVQGHTANPAVLKDFRGPVAEPPFSQHQDQVFRPGPNGLPLKSENSFTDTDIARATNLAIQHAYRQSNTQQPTVNPQQMAPGYIAHSVSASPFLNQAMQIISKVIGANYQIPPGHDPREYGRYMLSQAYQYIQRAQADASARQTLTPARPGLVKNPAAHPQSAPQNPQNAWASLGNPQQPQVGGMAGQARQQQAAAGQAQTPSGGVSIAQAQQLEPGAAPHWIKAGYGRFRVPPPPFQLTARQTVEQAMVNSKAFFNQLSDQVTRDSANMYTQINNTAREIQLLNRQALIALDPDSGPSTHDPRLQECVQAKLEDGQVVLGLKEGAKLGTFTDDSKAWKMGKIVDVDAGLSPPGRDGKRMGKITLYITE